MRKEIRIALYAMLLGASLVICIFSDTFTDMLPLDIRALAYIANGTVAMVCALNLMSLLFDE